MLVEALGIWPIIVRIGGREVECQKKRDWNMEGEESKEFRNN